MNLLSIISAKSDQQISAIYDSAVLQEFADQLSSRASTIVFECVASYGLMAFVVGFSLGILAGRQAFADTPNLDLTSTALVIGALGTLIGIIVGIVRGREKSFNLRLEAQKLLLQMRIEENTRKEARVSAE